MRTSACARERAAGCALGSQIQRSKRSVHGSHAPAALPLQPLAVSTCRIACTVLPVRRRCCSGCERHVAPLLPPLTPQSRVLEGADTHLAKPSVSLVYASTDNEAVPMGGGLRESRND